SHTASGEEQRRSNGSGFALWHEWSATGLLSRQALDGVSGVLERRYRYDVLDRLTGISDSHWGEQALRLNGTGQVVAERREQGRRQQARLFGYDSEQNLCEVSSIVPDGAGRLSAANAAVQSSAGYDAAGRVVMRGDSRYQYDACGRLVSKRESRAGFRPRDTQFGWDAQDRLVRVSLPDGSRWRYCYDAFGRRVSKVREGQAPSAQAVARVAYRWDGDQLSGQTQYRADGSVARAVQWVYEPGSFRPLAQVEEKGGRTQLHYIVTDLTGTARELCSETGEVHWRGEQALWGAHREEKIPIPLRRWLGDAANEEVYCELRYQGQVYDAETGLYYNRHRYYDPETAQYLSADPLGIAGGLRPQGYVHNPMEWVDPLGLVGCPEQRQRVLDNIEASRRARESSNLGGASPTLGSRTKEGFMKDHVSPDRETTLHTKSPGFNNNNGNEGGQFKRYGLDSHAGISPHVHQPIRNVSPKNGAVYGSQGSKTSNGGVTSPSNKDIKQLYDHVYNGKYGL
ncbi:RHS repeat domain-containing protein, partial [Dickeya chrysanthemi]|uniref:RHS repeat domain-containing protein n=1 Tax=Dickeya chrysanthemi TaxID=556 RepID=UPI001E53C123